MAELSNHSYHYDRTLLTSIYAPEHPEIAFEEEPCEEVDTKGGKAKKRTRRKKRMLTGVSKQRRAANERERKRLQIINVAYKDLKSALPLFPTESNISKIEIVRLASRTIKYLSDMLDAGDSMSQTRSPGGSVTSDNSESSSVLTESSLPDYIDTNDIDISNLLFHPDDVIAFGNDVPLPSNVRFDFDLKNEELGSSTSCSSLSSSSSSTTHPSTNSDATNSSTSSSLSDGFSGFDINLFLKDDRSQDDEDMKNDDVFPSMLSLW